MFWMFNGEPVINAPSFASGFVYIVRNEISGRMYIGQKRLLKTQIKRKAGKRNKKIIKESDWRDYYGSNKELLADIEYYGAVNFTREILKWCISKGDINYYELKYQIQHEVLEYPERYYNCYLGGRIHRNHLSCNKKPRD